MTSACMTNSIIISKSTKTNRTGLYCAIFRFHLPFKGYFRRAACYLRRNRETGRKHQMGRVVEDVAVVLHRRDEGANDEYLLRHQLGRPFPSDRHPSRGVVAVDGVAKNDDGGGDDDDVINGPVVREYRTRASR